MSKSRNQKWYDYEEEDYSDKRKRNKDIDRRKQKRIKNALRNKDVHMLSQQDEQ
jgi:hypothetical protein